MRSSSSERWPPMSTVKRIRTPDATDGHEDEENDAVSLHRGFTGNPDHWRVLWTLLLALCDARAQRKARRSLGSLQRISARTSAAQPTLPRLSMALSSASHDIVCRHRRRRLPFRGDDLEGFRRSLKITET